MRRTGFALVVLLLAGCSQGDGSESRPAPGDFSLSVVGPRRTPVKVLEALVTVESRAQEAVRGVYVDCRLMAKGEPVDSFPVNFRNVQSGESVTGKAYFNGTGDAVECRVSRVSPL